MVEGLEVTHSKNPAALSFLMLRVTLDMGA